MRATMRLKTKEGVRASPRMTPAWTLCAKDAMKPKRRVRASLAPKPIADLQAKFTCNPRGIACQHTIEIHVWTASHPRDETQEGDVSQTGAETQMRLAGHSRIENHYSAVGHFGEETQHRVASHHSISRTDEETQPTSASRCWSEPQTKNVSHAHVETQGLNASLDAYEPL